MLNILQISDIHLLSKGRYAFDTIDTYQRLADLALNLPNLKVNIDYVVLTGDVFQDEAGRDCCDVVNKIFNNYKVFYVAGNHDDVNLLRCLNAENVSSVNDSSFVFDTPECRIMGLDTSSGRHHGSISEDALGWLRENIDTEKTILLFMHHPPVAVYSAFMDKNLKELQGLREVLLEKKSGIRLCCGHVHRTVVAEYAGCMVFCCPSLAFEIELDFTDEGGSHYIDSESKAALHTVEMSGSVTSQVVQIPFSHSYRKHKFI